MPDNGNVIQLPGTSPIVVPTAPDVLLSKATALEMQAVAIAYDRLGDAYAAVIRANDEAAKASEAVAILLNVIIDRLVDEPTGGPTDAV